MQEPIEIATMFWGCVPVFVGCGVLLHRRRRLHPIAGRYPTLIALTNVTFTVICLLQGTIHYVGEYSLPCTFRLFVTNCLVPLPFLNVIVRAW